MQTWRVLADQRSKGFHWKGRCLFHWVTDTTFQSVSVLVILTKYRCRVLHVAHDGLGHMGYRKVLALIRWRFDWPLLTKEVTEYCASYEVCQRCSRASVRKAPMVAHAVPTELFESVAVDIVGLFPKG